ncbi:SHOCT domain-containing protein [Kutzneria chonburiensis]|uniref:SHOCT domain-containing protein n=1 Tax=Kutzneria chonburiensis TaxID=1483604 RepID=A0ABV6MNZ8_9PSEU|nr:SHOCT domain-containing protein [Kutzneria chonburiensis]
MDTYKAQGAEVTFDGDVLVLTRKRIGKDDVRRIPLAAVTDVRFKPGSTFTADLVQLVLNDEPPAEMTLLEPNTLAFPRTPKHKESLAALQARLQAAVEHNRATDGGPVAYDAPRQTLSQRLEDRTQRTKQNQAALQDGVQAAQAKLRDEWQAGQAAMREVRQAEQDTKQARQAARQAERDAKRAEREAQQAAQQAERDAKRAEREARQAEADRVRAEADRLAAEADERARIDGIRAKLADAGITRDDVVDAAVAYGSVPLAIGPIVRLLGPDEHMTRLTWAIFEEDGNTVALTDSRLIIAETGLFTDRVNEFPLTFIATVGVSHEFLSNELTVLLHAGPAVRLRRVEDIEGFADALRGAVRQANTPAATAPPPAAPQPDVMDQIAKLADLRAAGVLTDEEFQTKKTELLNRL